LKRNDDDVLARVVEFARAERARTVPRGEGIHLARAYHTGVGHVEHFRGALLPRLRGCGDLAGCRVLEVGSGAGFLASLLATTEVGYVVASDWSWTRFSPRSFFLLEAFQTIGRHWNLEGVVSLDAGHPNFNGKRMAFVQADGARLPFPDGTFDIVFSYSCLEHFPDLEGVFAEVLRVLRPGGLLYCESEKFWGARDGSHLYEILPAPWAHLLASPDDLWKLYEAEYGGKDILWPGRCVDREYFVGVLEHELNRRSVRAIKKILFESGCDLVFWQQLNRPEDRALLRQLRLRRALTNWPLEELLTSYLAFGLRKCPARLATHLILRLPWSLKQVIPRSLKNRLRAWFQR